MSNSSNDSSSGWEQIYQQVPLSAVPAHFAGIAQSPFTLEYLSTILRHCPRGGRSCETGSGSGESAVWLSLRGVRAEGLDLSPRLVERAQQVNALLGGSARFYPGDLFAFYASNQNSERYDVIHHQGVLEHFTLPQMRAALAQQVACAHWVVFSVPSVYYPFEPEFGDERLLPLAEWQRILEPFEVQECRLYGDPQHGEREHVLVVLQGQPVTDELLALMQVPKEPYPDGISAIVHTRNEAGRIVECLQSLQGWTDEIIVCDMESEDATLELAAPLATHILHHPRIANFDRARNVSAMRASYRWILFLDADERVPPRLGAALRQIIAAQSSGQAEPFAGMLLPFRHHFAGHWMRSLYPGYTTSRLLKNGRFVFNARLHSGAQVEGPVVTFPAQDPDLALVHYSYDSLSHYLSKLNNYTDGEAQNLYRDGAPFHWQNAIRDFVQDFQSYYVGRQAAQDGVHGFLYSFLSGFYRFEQHAKLYEKRFFAGQLQPQEQQVPASLEEMLEFALRVVRHRPIPAPLPLQVQAPVPTVATGARSDRDHAEADDAADVTHDLETNEAETGFAANDSALLVPLRLSEAPTPEPVAQHLPTTPIAWCAPFTDPSGYGEESRNFLFALDEIGVPLAAQILPWSHDEVDMSAQDRERLHALTQVAVPHGFTQVLHTLAPGFQRHPQAGVVIGRTMFETDRLPQDWVQRCQSLDYLWVPSEFHRQSFLGAGIPAHKLAIIPGSLDPQAYALAENEATLQAAIDALPAPEKSLLHGIAEEQAGGKTVFLSVFDWTGHKGWDVLLKSFLKAFQGREDVVLLLRVWSTMGYGSEGIQQQAAHSIQQELGLDLLADPRIRFLPQRLSRAGLCALYARSDAFVVASRGEGWGRPYMEAMACGKPTIGTNWSGHTAFMTSQNSYLIDCSVCDVPESGWRELPSYKGHRWAQPSEAHLIELLRQVRDNPEHARKVGQRARQEVLERFDRRVVAGLIQRELERIEALQATTSPAHLQETPQENQSLDNPTLAVRWEGAFFNWQSLGHVNREFALALLETNPDPSATSTPESDSSQTAPLIELSLLPTEPPQFDPQREARFAPLAQRQFQPLAQGAQVQGATVHVRHFFPPRFEAPPQGHFVLMQPWEYGYLPQQWIEPILTQVDQVWCYANYVRQVYLDSGIPADKLRVIPLGIDPEVFRPEGPSYVFTDEPGAAALHDLGERAARETFVFLFAGGSIHRKGIDILLEAYQRAFTALDDVCLVIKDTGTTTVYRDAHARDQILGLTQAANGPRVVYLDADLPAAQLAGVFRAADCLVQPYRGEGFCLPVLEAMACGTPVVVPRGGPTDDFVDESVGWLLDAAHQPFGVDEKGHGHIGPFECVGPTWQFEVSPDALARLLRQIGRDKGETRQRGEAASQRARQQWSWHQAAAQAREALQQLVQNGPPIRLKPMAEASSAPGLVSAAPVVPNLATEGLTPASPAEFPSSGTPRAQPTISLCMIVRDEERVLDACLESAKPWFDEIILVDTGSIDRTVEIAKSHGAKVFHFPWCDDFSAARNVSLDHAKGDWVCWIDADDTLPAQCGEELRRCAALAPDKTMGFMAQVHIPPAPGETGFTVVDHVKLFRNLPGLRFIGRIHEQILEPIHRLGGQVERSNAYVVHSGYDYSPAGQQKKRARDLTILEKDLADRPGHPFVLFNIGMTAYHMKEYDQAMPALQECLARTHSRESIVRKVYAMLAGCELEQGHVSEALGWLEKGLQLYPNDPELLFRGGILYREAGQLERAKGCYLKLLTEREQGHIDSLDVTMTGFKAHHNLALICQDLNDLGGAEHHFIQAIQMQKEFVPSWAGLIETYRRMGQSERAAAVEREMQNVLGRNGLAQNGLGQAELLTAPT